MKVSLAVEQLRRLHTQAGSCSSVSLLEPLLQVYWTRLAGFIPFWVAPNLLTLCGLVLLLVASFLLVIFAPLAKETAPAWVYFVNALAVLLHQSLDNVDVKQAEKTKSGSVLQELFDRCCKAFGVATVSLIGCCSLRLGLSPSLLFMFYMANLFAIYCTHWRAYVTGVLVVTKIDVVEGQLFLLVVHVVSGMVGPHIWHREVFGYEMSKLAVSAAIAALSHAIICTIQVILEGGQGKNGSTVADTSVLSPAIPFIILSSFTALTFTHSPSKLLQSTPVLAASLVGITATKLSVNVIWAQMSRSELNLFDSVLIGPVAVFINISLGAPLPEFYILCCSLLYTTFVLVVSFTQMCLQVADFCHLHCFSLTAKS